AHGGRAGGPGGRRSGAARGAAGAAWRSRGARVDVEQGARARARRVRVEHDRAAHARAVPDPAAAGCAVVRSALEVVFWACAALVVWTHVGYAVTLAALSGAANLLRRREQRRGRGGRSVEAGIPERAQAGRQAGRQAELAGRL